jgi:hypothetical protein
MSISTRIVFALMVVVISVERVIPQSPGGQTSGKKAGRFEYQVIPGQRPPAKSNMLRDLFDDDSKKSQKALEYLNQEGSIGWDLHAFAVTTRTGAMAGNRNDYVNCFYIRRPAEAKERLKFEYTVIDLTNMFGEVDNPKHEQLCEKLKSLGDDGWELVGVFSKCRGDGNSEWFKHLHLFKRIASP